MGDTSDPFPMLSLSSIELRSEAAYSQCTIGLHGARNGRDAVLPNAIVRELELLLQLLSL